MSIITEALKRAEKERGKPKEVREYLNKMFGPERKLTYRKEESVQDQPIAAKPSGNRGFRIFVGLLAFTIIALTAVNIFVIAPPPDNEMQSPDRLSDYSGTPPEAEAYVEPGVKDAVFGEKAGGMTGERQDEAAAEQFASGFSLTGIVWDAEDPWAVINNNVVRTGDTVEGAQVVSIGSEKVVLLFRDRTYDLRVK